MSKTIGSVRGMSDDLVRGILVTAVCEGANVRSRKGFDKLRAFAGRRFGRRVDNRVLVQILRRHWVSEPDRVTSAQRTRILAEASRLNGTRDTEEGKLHLRAFAAKEFSIILDNHTITQLLRRDEVATDSGRRWCGFRFQRSGFEHIPVVHTELE